MTRTFLRAFLSSLALASVSTPAWTAAAAAAVSEQAADADAAYLSIECDPKAHAYIDDVDTGRDTPITDFVVKAGRHTVTLVAPDGKKQVLGISLKSGDHKRVKIKM